MGLIFAFQRLVGALAAPIAKAYQAKQDRQAAAESAQAKLKLAGQEKRFNLNLKKAEWEALAKRQEPNSWKDEYVTLIITSPFALLFVAAMVSGYSGDMRYLDSVNLGLESLKSLGVELGELLNIVVLAAVSIKGMGLLRK
jgi:hypothetical protein